METASWTCPHGTTYTGTSDFISGARQAHDEEANWHYAAGRKSDRKINAIYQAALATEITDSTAYLRGFILGITALDRKEPRP